MTKKISELAAGADPDGTELIEATQDGVSVRLTAQQIANLGGTGGTVGALAGINNQTGTTYTFALSDAGKLVSGNNAAAQLYTIPPHASVAFDIGTFIHFGQAGTGAITVAAGAGVTLNSNSGYSTAGRYDPRGIVQVATDVWWVV